MKLLLKKSIQKCAKTVKKNYFLKWLDLFWYSWNLKLPSNNNGLKKRWYNFVSDVKTVLHDFISAATGFIQMIETTTWRYFEKHLKKLTTWSISKARELLIQEHLLWQKIYRWWFWNKCKNLLKLNFERFFHHTAFFYYQNFFEGILSTFS